MELRSPLLFFAPVTLLLSGTTNAFQDDCSSAAVVNVGTTAFDTTGATDSLPPFSCGSGGADLWYRFTANLGGQVTLSTCGSTFDTVVEVFAGNDCNLLVPVACNDDSCLTQSNVQFLALAGQEYLFRVGGFNGANGTGTLTIFEGAPLNDECIAAQPVTAGSYPFDTSNATTSLPPFACGQGGTDLWYRYNAPLDGPVTLSTCGSGFDTVLEVFTGIDCLVLLSLDCNDDSCSRQSELTFLAQATEDYFFRIGGFTGDGGPGTLTVEDLTSGGLGTNYCTAIPNSTGSTGELAASGLLEVTVNDLTLHAYELPPLAFGYFLNSDVQGFVPNVMNSVGNLCLGGDVGRFNRLGEVQNTGLDGAFELTIDLTNFPRPIGCGPR